MTKALYGVGLLVAAVSLMASCSDGESNTDNKGGSGSTAGSGTGGSSTAGSGTSGSKTGGSSSGGSSNGGSSNGGSNNNQGGDDGPGPGPQGGDGPGPFPQGGQGFGGDLEECGADQGNGDPCEQGDGACEDSDGNICFCGGGQGQDPEWTCLEDSIDCGDAPMNGGQCQGFGPCEGSDTCFCAGGNVFCGQM